MRRAKAALCIDEEVDLQSILEEMAEKNKEMEKSEDGSKDNEDEDDDNDKEMDKDRFSESVGSAQGSLSQTPTSFTPTLGPKVDHRKEIFLTPATSNELEKYEDFPSGSLQPEGLDVPDDDMRLGNKSEPILITNRSHSDCGLVPVELRRPYPILRSLSDSAASCHCSAESLVRPRSVETDNGLNIESTYKTDKGSSSLDSVSDEDFLLHSHNTIFWFICCSVLNPHNPMKHFTRRSHKYGFAFALKVHKADSKSSN
ncbi:serine/threonine-protein phosphatase 4 regulatory subunit 2-B-like [Penaeus monodon]|uniref:serine/threonine-protein phosphatase 4 regulatory subunit 2-B-like n=1 Tax=Penaeus monodon TaxID=6687 RepID=UPI0018A6EBBD|nr:serine/threonine-protein phosphatase 4 regulatory subunit 2-B-like [Penaeus monodon]